MPITDKLASLVPLEEIEQAAQQQIYDVLRLECVTKMAIMPDVHAGYDMPIGGVALLDGHVSPSFVGYDIGCGMCFCDTGVRTADLLPDEREKVAVYQKILHKIPTGFAGLPRTDYVMEYDRIASDLPLETAKRVSEKSVTQLGTLGGGNHFIEIGENRAGNVCVTIHSGSRNVGHTIGGWYMKQGRLLAAGSELGQSYIRDLRFALEWALANRRKMMVLVLNALNLPISQSAAALRGMVNENHNHAVHTPEGWLHRKGATPADLGRLGIIPANMRDGVYITRGLGNQDYLSSASHGCGRVMGRNQAKKSLDLTAFKEQMRGIVASTDKEVLDEAPGAYKDINYVLNRQEGVVIEVVDFVRPLINVKAQESDSRR